MDRLDRKEPHMTRTIPRPDASEYASHYEGYVSKVPDGNLLEILEDQRQHTQELLAGLTEARGLHRYAPGKWSIKEVIGHVTDAERVFSYRALRFGRGDQTPLPGFDETVYAPAGKFDLRPLPALAADLNAVRLASIALFAGLDAEALARRGMASNHEVSVRALAFIIAGHERHHIGILRERYLR
jgi:DinB superfamily